MAEVITRLKVDNQGFDQKIKNAQRSLDQFGLKGSEAGKKLSGLTNMFSSGITKIGPWGAALAAAGAAMKVVGDAFTSNEVLADRWAGTMEGAKGVYNGFLNALNTGDFSSFVDNMKSIISEAREAYDALDNLGTFNAFSQIGMAKAQANFDQALVDFKAGKIDKKGVEAARNAYADMLEERKKLENEAYIQEIESYAKQHNIDAKMLQEALEGNWGDFDKLKKTAMTGEENGFWRKMFSGSDRAAGNDQEKFAQAIQQMTDDDVKRIQGLGKAAWDSEQAITALDRRMQRVNTEKKVDKASTKSQKVELDMFEKRRKEIEETEKAIFELSQKIGTTADENERAWATNQLDSYIEKLNKLNGVVEETAEDVKSMNQSFSMEGISNVLKDARKRQAGSEVGSYEYNYFGGKALDVTTFQNILQEQLSSGVDTSMMEGIWEQILGGENIPDSVWEGLAADINEKLAELGIEPIELDVKTGTISSASKEAKLEAKETGQAWQNAVAAVNNVGNALQQIEDPAAKVSGIVMQAVANIALGFAQATASKATGAAGVFGWIAAATAGLATMTATIASIKSATSGYAEGGLILPNGSPYQGDNIVARLNAGEGVLTADGIENAGRLASQTNVSSGMLGLRTEVSGENLAIVLDNNNRRRGRSKSVR